MSIATDYAERAGETPKLGCGRAYPWPHDIAHLLVSHSGCVSLFIPSPLTLDTQSAIAFAKDILRVFGEPPAGALGDAKPYAIRCMTISFGCAEEAVYEYQKIIASAIEAERRRVPHA